MDKGIYGLYLDIVAGKSPDYTFFGTGLQQTFEKEGQKGLIALLNRALQAERKKLVKIKIPQELLNEVAQKKSEELFDWYGPNKATSDKERRKQIKYAFRERQLQLAEEKARMLGELIERNSKIRASKDLAKLFDTEPKARYAIQLCQGNDVDIADILAVVYDGRITRENAIKLLQEPSLRDYLHEIKRPQAIGDIIEPAEGIIKFDKNNTIRDIFYRRLEKYRKEKLGAKPSPEQIREFDKELKDYYNSKWKTHK